MKYKKRVSRLNKISQFNANLEEKSRKRQCITPGCTRKKGYRDAFCVTCREEITQSQETQHTPTTAIVYNIADITSA